MSSRIDTSYRFSDFLEAIRLQGRVVSALVMREIRTRFGRYQIGYLWALIDPCAHIATWLLIFVAMRQASPVHDMSPLVFIATGIVPLFFYRWVSGYLKGSLRSNRGLADYPQIKNVDFWISRFLLEAWAMSCVALIVFSVLIGAAGAAPPRDVGGCILACAMLLLLGLGFGAFNSVMVILSPTYEMILGISRRVLYLTAGIFFLGDRLPPQLLAWISLNPIFHGIELFRSYYSHTYVSSIASPAYLLTCGLGFLLLGLAAERAARDYIARIKEGPQELDDEAFEE